MLRNTAILASVVAVLLIGIMAINAVRHDDDGGGREPVDPSISAGAFDPSSARPLDDTGHFGTSRDAWLESVGADGKVARQFRYGKLTPRAEGEFDVVKPEARLFLAPHRVVHLSAASGYIVAHGNFPQRGTFTGGVRINLYESAPGTTVDAQPGSADHVLTAELDSANFDARTGRIDTDGAVVVRARDAEFLGRGMTLVYNEPNQRIDYLEITRGKSLRYRLADDAAGGPTGAGAATGDAATGGPAADAVAAQYYRIEFERNVRVRHGGRSIDAAKLTGYFAMRHEAEAGSASSAGVPGHALADAGDGAAPPADEVIVTWQGKMVIRPEASRPRMLRTRDDLYLSFTGEPVVIVSDRGDQRDRVTCATVNYLNSTGRVDALGSDAHPLTIDAAELGDVEATGVTVRLNDDIATLRGPGRIAADAERPGDRGLPPGFAIGWTDRLDLHLDPGESDGVRRAAFYGGVQVNDKRFAMSGDQLDIDFVPGPDGERRVGAVTARTAAVAGGDGTIFGEKLTLTLADDNRPTGLVGEGGVVVDSKDERINADRLAVTFQPTGDDEVEIATARASGNVTLQLRGGAVVHAPRLEADETTGRAVLRSLGDQRVSIKQDNGTLTVDELEVTEHGQLARADGPGEFTLVEPADAARPHGRTVRVTWANGMVYREAGSTLDLVGKVVAASSDRPNHENRLSGERMRLDLSGGATGDGDAARQALKRMRLTGDVVLLSTRWADASRKRVETRLRIGGPELVFDNPSQRATVTGNGSMLVEDYRAGGSGGGVASGRVALSGRGATVFTWTGSMTMDGAQTDLIIERGVNMTHRPAGDGTRLVEMQAGKLVANMKDIGGLSALETSRVESMTIDEIAATGSVQLRDAGKLISAEQMRYDGDSETVVLTAPKGRQVTVVNTSEPRPIRAERITWDLRHDRLTVDQPGY